MAHDKPFSSRRHEVSRVEGFSDAVFAFAVTLLVVSLEVPHTFAELWTSMRGFLAFAICFAILFQVWWRHFNFFRRYGLEDPTTIALTGLLLFVVLFYVYPLKFVFGWLVESLIFGFGQEAVRGDGVHEILVTRRDSVRLMQIYSTGVVAVFGVFGWLYSHAYRLREALRLTPGEILLTRVSIIDNAGFAALGLVSIAIATFGGFAMAPAIAGMLYCLIGPFKYALGWWTAKQQRLLAARSAAEAALP